MVKAKKATSKKSKQDETSLDAETPVEDSVAIDGKTEDNPEEATQENGDDSSPKKKSKGKTPKKEEAEESVKEEESNQQNGAEDAGTKKKSVSKKAAKPQKAQTEPARKSSRTPKPVVKEGTEEHSYDKFKEENPNMARKRASSKSSTKSAKKLKKEEKDYEVTEIVGMRVKNGKKEFKIRWKGYKASDDSWEPEKHLSCQDLISKYLEEHKDDVQNEEKKPAKKTPAKSKSKRSKAK